MDRTEGAQSLMETQVAWIIVAVAGLGTLVGVFALTQPIPSAWLRWLIRCLTAVWLLVPWKIQVVEGYYAPAFIVALFEGLFRSDGNPRPALMLLALVTLFVLAVFLAVGALRWARSSRQ